MPGATAKYGLPYPVSTDALSDGDDRIKALAERLDLLIGESGAQAITLAANTNNTVRVNYSRSYAAIAPLVPLAMATMNTTNTNGCVYWTTGHDATGFTLGARCAVAATYTINWSVRP